MATLIDFITSLFGWLPAPLTVVFSFVVVLFVFVIILKLIKLILDVIPFL